MATVFQAPRDDRFANAANNIAGIIAAIISGTRERGRDREWETALESIVSPQGSAPSSNIAASPDRSKESSYALDPQRSSSANYSDGSNSIGSQPMTKAEARQTLYNTYRGRKDPLAIEKLLNEIYPAQAAEAADYINTETGALERTTPSQDSSFLEKYRLAPSGTKTERLFYDEPTLKPAGTFAQGAKVSKGLLTRTEWDTKYGASSKSGSSELEKYNMEIDGLISANNSLNSDLPPLNPEQRNIRNRAVQIIENKTGIDKALTDAFSTRFGFDTSFAEKDVPVVNRARQLIEDKVLRDNLPWRKAVEEAAIEAGSEISEEELTRLRTMTKEGLAGRKNIQPEEPGVFDKLQAAARGEDQESLDPNAVQYSVKHALPDGTPVTVNIPASVDLASDNAVSNLTVFLKQSYNFTNAEALEFIRNNFVPTGESTGKGK